MGLLPPSLFGVPSAMLRGGYIQMALFLGTPKLESRNCPEIVPVATLTWPSVGVKPNTRKSWGFGVLRDS
jgi:hypothetical protein